MRTAQQGCLEGGWALGEGEAPCVGLGRGEEGYLQGERGKQRAAWVGGQGFTQKTAGVGGSRKDRRVCPVRVPCVFSQVGRGGASSSVS